MSVSLNRVQLIGYLGGSPEKRSTKDGMEVTSFSLATETRWKDRQTGEPRSNAEWHKIVSFNHNINQIASAYLSKGSRIYVEGSIQSRKFRGKDNVEKVTVEIVLGFDGKLIMLDKNEKSTSSQAYSKPSTSAAPSYENIFDDEIPF